MTESLADWLLVQLAADEQVARAASDAGHPDWKMRDPDGFGHIVDGNNNAVVYDEGAPTFEEAAHIVLWDPARVLADIDSKRQLLGEHYEMHRDIGWLDDGDEASDELPVCGCCVPKHSHFRTRADVPIYPCRTVRLLALPYTDRTGYQEKWKK